VPAEEAEVRVTTPGSSGTGASGMTTIGRTRSSFPRIGASRLQTLRRIVLPAVLPAMLTGFTLAFARAVGEYGSVVFISGNMPMRTEIVPLLIMTKLEQYDTAGATALGVSMLMISFTVLLAINALQRWAGRHRRHA
jgi:sulfate transport system permease protein